MKHEIFRQDSVIDEIQLKNKDVDSVLHSEESGWGVRVFDRGIGFASGTGEVEWEKAKQIARLNKSPEFSLPSNCKTKNVKVFDGRLDCQFIEDFTERFVSLASDSKALPTFSKFRLYDMSINLENSEGLDVSSRERLFRFETSLKVKKKNKVSEVYVVKWTRSAKGISDAELREMLKGAEAAIESKPPESFVGDVIFSPELVCDLLYPVVSYHAGGEAHYTKKSVFNGVVADKKLSVHDDGTYDFGILSAPFDGEGVACQKTPVIRRGKFTSTINDLMYAKITKKKSTGNALRMPYLGGPDNAYSVAPSLGGRNLVVKAGNKSRDQLVSGVDRGLFVEECSWLNPDMLTGAFGSEIRRGFLIENGKITRSIKGGNVSGNVLELIKNVVAVGKDARVASGHTLAAVSPHVCFGNVKVST